MSCLGRVIVLITLASPHAMYAQTTVSIDAEDLVITRLDGTGSTRVNLGSDYVFLAAANAHHAYVLRRNDGFGFVVKVDLNTGEQQGLVPRLPCCAYSFAVSPDDKTLFIGSEELEHGEIAAYN